MIETLDESKKISVEIENKLAAAQVTEKRLDDARQKYTVVAVHSTALFFCIADLSMSFPSHVALIVQAMLIRCISTRCYGSSCYS